MIIVWLAILGATIVAGLMAALAWFLARKKKPLPRELALWAARLWVFNLIFDLAILYFFMPAITGPYWGGQWLFWPLLLTGLFALLGTNVRSIRAAIDSFTEQLNRGEVGVRFERGRPRLRRERTVDASGTRAGVPSTAGVAGVVAIALVLVLSLVGNAVITAATTWTDANTKALAAIPNIVTQSNTDTLPPTNINHIVLVNQGVAAYLGQQVLASGGQNLGSQYHTDQGDYTLQSVGGHLYWIAPLIYNNVWANLGNWQSPGFVVVDAEDPNAAAKLMTGYHIRYLPDALLNQDLLRHVYLSGYTNGNLADPTLEVNDKWQPYYTVSLMVPSRGFTGQVVRQVLLVDAQSGKITPYAIGKVPSWVDRVIPSDAVTDYLTWWGKWKSAPWFNPSGAHQQVPAGSMELVYNSADQCVWLQPMTSNSSGDQSSTGVVLFDTRDMTGHFYPLSGIGVSDTVANTLTSNPANIQHYGVGSAQLYQIYNVPTWVATFTHEVDGGEIFEAVGIVDAQHLSGANVIMAPTKAQALAQYAQWLADHNVQGSGTAPSGTETTVSGTVQRINATTQNGTTVYYMLINGQSRIFEAPLSLSPELPLVQPGDQVQGTYLDTGLTTVTLDSFTDQSIHVAGSATPTAGT
jgi:hypothetical protein